MGPYEGKDLGERNVLPPRHKASDKKFYIGRIAHP